MLRSHRAALLFSLSTDSTPLIQSCRAHVALQKRIGSIPAQAIGLLLWHYSMLLLLEKSMQLVLALACFSTAVMGFHCGPADLSDSQYECKRNERDCVLNLYDKQITRWDNNTLATCVQNLTVSQRAGIRVINLRSATVLGDIFQGKLEFAPGAFESASSLGFTGVAVLVLTQNDIATLKPHAFRGLSQLQELFLISCKITSIAPKVSKAELRGHFLTLCFLAGIRRLTQTRYIRHVLRSVLAANDRFHESSKRHILRTQ